MASGPRSCAHILMHIRFFDGVILMSDPRPAISRRIDTEVLSERSVGHEAASLLAPADAWHRYRWEPPALDEWRTHDQLEARMRGSVVNDIADELLASLPVDEVAVRAAWQRRHDEEIARPRMRPLVPRQASALTAFEVDWMYRLAESAAQKLAYWGRIDEMQEGLWLPPAMAPACKGGREDYRVTSRATGHQFLIDLKLLKRPMSSSSWPKDELYAEAYLVAAAALGRPADGVAVLDVRHGELSWLMSRDLASAGDGAVLRGVCRRVFGMRDELAPRVVATLAARGA